MNLPPRVIQSALIAATAVVCWLGMQDIHECGHCLGALATGGTIRQVVLNPLTISRTDLGVNPHPLAVVWSGPVLGVLFPLAFWALAAATGLRGSFVARFFAGFCLIANGTYLLVGSISGAGDCGDLIRNGSPFWQLWLFGLLAIPLGLRLWHRQAANFGFGSAGQPVAASVAYLAILTALLLLSLGFAIGGR